MKNLLVLYFCASVFYARSQEKSNLSNSASGAMARFSTQFAAATLYNELWKLGYCTNTDSASTRYLLLRDDISGERIAEFVTFTNVEKTKSATAFINYAKAKLFIAVFFPAPNSCSDDGMILSAEKGKKKRATLFMARLGSTIACAGDTILLNGPVKDEDRRTFECLKKLWHTIQPIFDKDGREVARRVKEIKKSEIISCGKNAKATFKKFLDCWKKAKTRIN